MTDNPYDPLGFPLPNLPRPGKPVSSLTLLDTVSTAAPRGKGLDDRSGSESPNGGSRRRPRHLGARADRGAAGVRAPYPLALGRERGLCHKCGGRR